MKAILFGTGWRAGFFLRIASALPELLSIEAVATRSSERKAALSAEGLHVFDDIESALCVPHDSVIVASGKDGFLPLMLLLRERGERVFSETTFSSLTDDELKRLRGMEGVTLEQYPFDPLYAACISSLPLLGRVTQVRISGLHNHHSAALAKRILSLGTSAPDEVHSIDFPSGIIRTGARGGMLAEGELETYTRRVRILRFGEKLFIHDFSSNQYHSYLFGKELEIRGERGVITLEGIDMINSENLPVRIPFSVRRDTEMWNSGSSLSLISAGERVVYRSRFYPSLLSDDELGIAEIIYRAEKGLPVPSIDDGIDDALLGRLL